MPPHLDETTSATPGISPGVVANDEPVLRTLFDPHHVANGQLVVTAVALKDLLDRGVSVDRQNHTTAAAMKERRDKKLEEKKGKWRDAGAARLNTGEVRALTDSTGKRAFVVIDTALPENKAHADIYAADPSRGETYARELRDLLIPMLNNRQDIEAWF